MLDNKFVKILVFLVLPVIIAIMSFMYGFAESLFSPGDLTRGHVEYSHNCFKCHFPFQNISSSCLDCHEKIEKSINDKAGFHGLMAEDEARQCVKCHTDHKGREVLVVQDRRSEGALLATLANVEKINELKEGSLKLKPEHQELFKLAKSPFVWDEFVPDFEKKFDHSLTGYPLIGAHGEVKCKECHSSIKEFKPSEKAGVFPEFRLSDLNKKEFCYSCHKKDDEGKTGHKGKYGKDCGSCHTLQPADGKTSLNKKKGEGWKYLLPKIKKHHDKAPHLLEGKHAKAACRDCHKEAPFKELWKKQEELWNADAERDKGFVLKEKILQMFGVNIAQAKKLADFRPVWQNQESNLACIMCHQKQDEGKEGHKGKYGKQCQNCHEPHREFKRSRDLVHFYHRDTSKLTGKHVDVKCVKCHENVPFSGTPHEDKCYSCHKKDDDKSHQKTLGEDCKKCHNTKSWEKTSFDHQLTSFVLKESHQKVKCQGCHPDWHAAKEKLKLYKKIMRTDCYFCHARDDKHRGTFKTDCERCHRESSWNDVIEY